MILMEKLFKESAIQVKSVNYIVLDLEWNQSNQGKEGENKNIPVEIIEIGAVKLDSNKNMLQEFDELVCPQVYKEMNHITRKLIHLQMEELKKGREFPDAVKEFLAWCGNAEDYIFCTWGPSDLLELQRNIQFYGMEPIAKGPIVFLDVQKLFSIAYEDSKSRRSLESAIDFLGIKKGAPFHRAFSDACYTAKVLAGINKETEKFVSFDTFHLPKSRKEEVHIAFDQYAKYISMEFKEKQDAILDREVLSTRCHLCGNPARRKIKWFSLNGKHYYCAAYCKKHGYIKGKIRLRKSEDNHVYAVKTLKFITEQELSLIREKRNCSNLTKKQRRNGKKDK